MQQSPDSYPNPDLAILADNKARWNTPEYRRHGFQNLHRINRYGIICPKSVAVMQRQLYSRS